MISVHYGWAGFTLDTANINMFYKNDHYDIECDFCFIFKTQEELNDLLISCGKYSKPRTSGFTTELQTVFYSDEEFAELVLMY